MKKILIISMISVIIIVGIVITYKIIIKNNKNEASQEILKEQQEEIKILDEENEGILNEINNIDNEIKKLEELKQEGSNTEVVKEKINSLKEEKQQLIIQKQDNTIKEEKTNDNLNNIGNTLNNSNSNSINNNSSDSTNNGNKNNNQENEVTNESSKKEEYTINVSTNNIAIEVDEKISFSVNFTNPNVTFTSSSIMEKDNAGIIDMYFTRISDSQYTVNVKGLKVGTAEIEITELNTPNVKKLVNVTVKPQKQPSGISLNKSRVEITYGQKQVVSIGANITPEGAKNRNIIWKSSNEKVAKPNFYKGEDDIACTIIPVGGGTCTFTATTE